MCLAAAPPGSAGRWPSCSPATTTARPIMCRSGKTTHPHPPAFRLSQSHSKFATPKVNQRLWPRFRHLDTSMRLSPAVTSTSRRNSATSGSGGGGSTPSPEKDETKDVLAGHNNTAARSATAKR